MKIKFLGTTEAEDQIVEIPDGASVVEMELPRKELDETNYGPWPATTILCVAMLSVVAIVWIIFRG